MLCKNAAAEFSERGAIIKEFRCGFMPSHMQAVKMEINVSGSVGIYLENVHFGG